MGNERNCTCIDVAFINGSVITINEKDEIAEAVGIKDNKIVFVGSTEDLTEIIDQKTKIIDLEGKSLVPGFIDSHFHPILKGLFGDDEDSSIINTSYDNCHSIEDILKFVRKAAKKRGPGAWISMMGYAQNSILEKRHITLEELDQAAPDNPVQCMRNCGHICIYNSKALETIGIFNVQDAGEFLALSYKIMQKLCRERKFKPREYMMIHDVYGKHFAIEENEHLFALGLLTGLGNEYCRLGSSKFMIDGGTSGPSCATREPYSHDPDMPGILAWKREEVREYIRKINDADCQATAHAVGDLAIEFMVEGYEHAFRTNPRPEARHRIEHCAITDLDLIQRMARMNICPTCNPGFIAWNGSNYTRYYGDRMKYFMALRTMIDEGVNVSIASDSPSGPVEPIAIIDAAVNRIDRVTGIQTDPTQAITVMEAIRLSTLNGAYNSYEEQIKGSIETGKMADLVVLSKDILKIPKENILDVEIQMTMIDGKIEYEQTDGKIKYEQTYGK